MKVERVALICFHTCPLAAPGEGKAGGMNVYVKELSKCLGRIGIEVNVFTRCHTNQEQDVVELDPGVRLVHLEAGPPDTKMEDHFLSLPSFMEHLNDFAKKEGVQYDLVHSHYWLSGWVGSRVAAGWSVPHVLNFHTLAQIKMQVIPEEAESPLRATVERELMDSADMIIASSPHEKDAMVQRYKALAQRIQVVPCGVDLSLFKPLDIEEARKSLGLNGEKVIVYVGRLERIKGLELLLRTTAIMDGKDDLKVLIIGGNLSEEDEVTYLREMADELGIGDIMEFVGIVDQRTLPLYYNAADVCVVPSHYESFSLAALEALACGTPVVATRVGGLPTVVQHGRTGYLLSWRCPEPFADSLEVILSSRGLQRSMSLAARKRAEGMGWEMVAGKLHNLYHSLLEEMALSVAGA